MMRNALRVRLLGGAAVAIFVALALAWLAMTLLFARHIERRVEEELKRDARQLVAGLFVDRAGDTVLRQRPTDPRFAAPASGLYWQVTAPADTERSRSLWDQSLPPSTTAIAAGWQSRSMAGPFGKGLFVLERLVQPEGARQPLLIQVAADEDGMRQARDAFGRELALFLALLWLCLSGAAWVQVHLGLRPLAALRRELVALRHNPAARLSARYPSEVEPLTEAINALAGAREADLRRARQRAADLAHALKTPLAALSAQSRLVREGNPAAADGLDRVTAAVGAAVETELARARAAASRQSGAVTQAAPLPVAESLIAVLERTEKGMRIDYDIDLADTLRVTVAPEDLSEILGTLLENAVRFARRQVRIGGSAIDDVVCLSVEDDGPGIAADRAAEALIRGRRLDEAGGGHGMGLAIARELVEATGGDIALGTSGLGGLKVTLRWRTPTA